VSCSAGSLPASFHASRDLKDRRLVAKVTERSMALEVKGMTPLLGVFDMPTAIRFYRDLLGFEVVASSQPGDDCGWCLLRLHGVELMLNTLYDKGQRPASYDPQRMKMHRDTALFFGTPDVDAAYRYLREMGVDAEEPFDQSYGMRQCYVLDPDGYQLCFQWAVKK
jgi:glyoxylase I family protein